MFRVLSRESLDVEAGGDNGGDGYEVIFRIPAAEDSIKQNNNGMYTIIYPRYEDANKRRSTASDGQDVGTHEHILQAGKEEQKEVPGQVYISYCPEEEECKQLADLVSEVLLKPYNIPHVLLDTEQGLYTFEDFEGHVVASEYVLIIMSEGYLAGVESREGRVFREASAAVTGGITIIPIKAADYKYPSPTWQQSLEPAIIRKIFLPKPIDYFQNWGHFEAFEEALMKSLNQIPNCESLQSPLYHFLEKLSLGKHTTKLYNTFRLNYPDQLKNTSNAEEICDQINMDKQDFGRLEAALAKVQDRPHIPEDQQNVKALVEILWSSGRNNAPLRQAAAHEIRRMSVTEAGLAEIRAFAGLESLIKLASEISAPEKAASLWSLRNFAMDEMYRTKMGQSNVIPTVVAALRHVDTQIVHPACALAQALTIDNISNIQIIGKAGAVKFLVHLLDSKHEGIRLAALATISNLSTTDENKIRIGKYGGVVKIVRLMAQTDTPIHSLGVLAVSALYNLVQNDINRLKSWREGAVDSLRKYTVSSHLGIVPLALNTCAILMAGARIQPHENFKTKAGRRLTGEKMRDSVHRLASSQTAMLANTLQKVDEQNLVRPSTSQSHSARKNSKVTDLELVENVGTEDNKLLKMSYYETYSMPSTSPQLSEEEMYYQRQNLQRQNSISATYIPIKSRIYAVPMGQNGSTCFGRRLSTREQEVSVDRLTYRQFKKSSTTDNKRRVQSAATCGYKFG